jgi:hypothetical protein
LNADIRDRQPRNFQVDSGIGASLSGIGGNASRTSQANSKNSKDGGKCSDNQSADGCNGSVVFNYVSASTMPVNFQRAEESGQTLFKGIACIVMALVYACLIEP